MKLIVLISMFLALLGCGDGGANKIKYGTYTDKRDGYTYKTVKIGEQIWLAENLRYLPSLNGVKNSHEEPQYYVYDYTGSDILEAKKSKYYRTFGALYNWPAATTACPSGWHFPDSAEWAELEEYVGNETAGKQLKSIVGWKHNNFYDVTSGFAALPSGYFYSGRFDEALKSGYWWSATESEAAYAYSRQMFYHAHLYLNLDRKNSGFSVRCVQDE